ncbi:MAG: hypothetical protein RL637_1120 [Pseudomonadota bacterium]|jgi:outer membrane biogenesis lipoprotein LolB
MMKFSQLSGHLLFASVLSLTACATTGNNANSEDIPSLVGTKWHYTDKQWNYDIEFAENGVLHSRHPNDKTPDNDTWEQDRDTVKFYYNNKFSQYQGVLSGANVMSGTAKNTKGNTWEWSATRVDN